MDKFDGKEFDVGDKVIFCNEYRDVAPWSKKNILVNSIGEVIKLFRSVSGYIVYLILVNDIEVELLWPARFYIEKAA